MSGALPQARALIDRGWKIVGSAGITYAGAAAAVEAIQAGVPAITSAIEGAISAGAQVASTVGATATAVIPIVGVAIAITTRILLGLRAQRRAASAKKQCQRAALLYAVDLAIQRSAGSQLLELSAIPTASWPTCWHKGLKTKDRYNGRMSTEILQGLVRTVLRRDVLDDVDNYAREVYGIARAPIKPTLSQRGPLICPWFGPFAHITESRPSSALLEELAPEGLAACLAISEALLSVRPPQLAVAASRQISRLVSYGVYESPQGADHGAGPKIVTTTSGGELASLLRGYVG